MSAGPGCATHVSVRYKHTSRVVRWLWTALYGRACHLHCVLSCPTTVGNQLLTQLLDGNGLSLLFAGLPSMRSTATAAFSTLARSTTRSRLLLRPTRAMSTSVPSDVPKYTYLAVIPDLADSKR